MEFERCDPLWWPLTRSAEGRIRLMYSFVRLFYHHLLSLSFSFLSILTLYGMHPILMCHKMVQKHSICIHQMHNFSILLSVFFFFLARNFFKIFTDYCSNSSNFWLTSFLRENSFLVLLASFSAFLSKGQSNELSLVVVVFLCESQPKEDFEVDILDYCGQKKSFKLQAWLRVKRIDYSKRLRPINFSEERLKVAGEEGLDNQSSYWEENRDFDPLHIFLQIRKLQCINVYKNKWVEHINNDVDKSYSNIPHVYS